MCGAAEHRQQPGLSLGTNRKTEGSSPLLREPNICNLLCPAGKREHQRTMFSGPRRPRPSLETCPQNLVGRRRARRGPRGLRAALVVSGAGSQTSTPNCPPCTKRAVWWCNKSQRGWQGDCTFQLECASVGLAPERQMLRADGRGEGGGRLPENQSKERPRAPAAGRPPLWAPEPGRSLSLCLLLRGSPTPTRNPGAGGCSKERGQTHGHPLSVGAPRGSSPDGLERARLHLFSDPEGLHKWDSFAN